MILFMLIQRSGAFCCEVRWLMIYDVLAILDMYFLLFGLGSS